MAYLIDRRVQSKKKSAVNRERFLRRHKGQIKDAVTRAIKGRSITDIENGEKVSIPVKDTSGPSFGHTQGGVWETVSPGNQEYLKGDRIQRQRGGSGSGKGKAGNSEETSEDDFIFELTREEFMNYFFEDLELPNLVKTQLTSTTEFRNQRAGYKMSGTTSTIHVLRSLRGALGRRIAVGGGSRRRMHEAEDELAQLLQDGVPEDDPLVVQLRREIHHLHTKLLAIPFIDPFDLRYSNRVKVPKPSSQAVMFCIMDVSGSMDENKKDTGKRFFILLYLFLTRAYEKIDVVFIRHHTQAAEVDEEEFFNSRESGGTVVSSALHLLARIMHERYSSSDWNAYVAQASDGDNWDNDSVTCREMLIDTIMPAVQYYAYVEITDGEAQNLWHEYTQVKEAHSHFAMQKIEKSADIYPVFRELFKKAAEMSDFDTPNPKKGRLPDQSEWTFDLIEQAHEEIRRVARNFNLDTYPNQLEIITAEQMMDAYASVGMPISYNHWSFGKHFLSTEKGYKRGQMGLAYEIVINSNPCIAYLMEENSLTMQALVIAHASYGHNSFFKGNYLFRTWTDAEAIIDYMVFAKNYIADCEQRYGLDEVEELLDSCHALQNYGVDRYKRPAKLSLEKEHARQKEREAYLQTQINDLWRTLPRRQEVEVEEGPQRFPSEPQENLLYFFEKYAPLLEPWQREIVRIVRKISQYFYPQRQTQVMNEGWATFWHYTILNQLHEEGIVGDGFMIEFLQSHTNVVYQPPVSSPYYSGINPYALGFGMMRDIRRICEAPTDEDRYWFPDIAGREWGPVLDFAMRNFKDESFIAQYLSPKMIRDFHLFAVLDDDKDDKLKVSAIHDESGYSYVRNRLAEQYNLGNREPNIQVWNVDTHGDRSLTLRHSQFLRRPLNQQTDEMLKHVARLWGFDVRLETVAPDGTVLNTREHKWEKRSRTN